MDPDHLFPELDDRLAAIEETADNAAVDPEHTPEADGFRVDSLDKANWALRKLAVRDAELAEARAFAEREQRRVAAWIEGEEARHQQRTRYLRGLLEGFHRDRRDHDPDAKTLRLPAGELWARPGRDRWDYDEPVFVAWAQEHGRVDLIRRPDPQPEKNAVKKALAMAAHDEDETGPVPVIDPDTGDTIPGVTVIPGEFRYTARPNLEGGRQA